MIEAGDIHPFYVTPEWRALVPVVLRMDRSECQICKAHGRFHRADLVHHVNHVKRRPDLALDIWFTDENGSKARNLISVCRPCHETVCHPSRMRRKQASGFRTPERWD